ncbi:hypothetical protein [uncultured Adlercreutzia sp.]|uniref:hypothetical protein n=1 Tax=uncultured Adlercreutzia sp. TaxID=875803 RepID=UPI0025F5C158|nr:hypothetical protein [uncultured Adlercreutzia sp.]
MALFLEPLDDPYGYDAYRLLRSKVVPAGLATVVLGCALGSFGLWLPHLRGEDAHAIATELTDFLGMVSGGALAIPVADNNAAVSLIVMIFLIIGFSLLGYARTNRKNYMAAYPRIKNFYTPSQKAQALRVRRRWIAGGISGLALSATLGAAIACAEAAAGMDALSHRGLAIPVGATLAGVAPSLWMIAHGVIVGDRVDIFEYNYQALSQTNRYDIRVNQTGERQRVMLGEQRIASRFHVVNRCILGVGIFCTVMLWVVPSLHTPFAFVPLAVACLLWYVVYKVGEQLARRRYEAPDPDTDDVEESAALAKQQKPPKFKA